MIAESAKPQTIARRLEHSLLPIAGRGLDVGAGPADMPASWRWWEQLGMDCTPWDAHNGDAHTLPGIAPASFDWLFSSHLLEHLERPAEALIRWAEVVRPGGLMLLSVPHRDLYEGRLILPSNWNHDHKRFYLPDRDEPPDTVGLRPWLEAGCDYGRFELWQLEIGDRDCVPAAPGRHATGEYCIDALLRVRERA
jgi:SAM-dependent methyltransferase